MNDVSKEFFTPEKRYTGAPDTISVLAGRERVVLNFRIMDKAIKRINIYWDNRSDSLILGDLSIEVSPQEFMVNIPNLSEGSHSFDIVTQDDAGNKSITSSAVGKVYGEDYQNSLLNTPLQPDMDAGVNLVVKWGNPDLTALGMDFVYTNLSGVESTIFWPANVFGQKFEKNMPVDDFQAGTIAKYRTYYLPETTAVDTFYTDFVEVRIKGVIDYPRNTWIPTAEYDPANNANGANYPDATAPRTPALALDGNLYTHWHMLKTHNYPHYFVVDMNDELEISGFYVQQREDKNGVLMATPIKKIYFQVSTDGVFSARSPTPYEYTMLQETGKQRFELPAEAQGKYRYFRLWVQSDYANGTTGTGLAELGAYYREE
jgi:hypothetical protein